MIDVSSMTQMAQSQTVVPDTVRTVEPVQATTPSKGADSAGQQGQDAQKHASESLQPQSREFGDKNRILSADATLQFRVDVESQNLVVSLLDAEGELIRQMPSELIMRLARRLDEIQAQGQLGFDDVA